METLRSFPPSPLTRMNAVQSSVVRMPPNRTGAVPRPVGLLGCVNHIHMRGIVAGNQAGDGGGSPGGRSYSCAPRACGCGDRIRTR